MGFDPRRWRPPPGGRPVTANLDALLAENEALRRELRQLREDFERLRRQRPPGVPPWPRSGSSAPHSRNRVSEGAAPSVTAERVERWVAVMARHPHWSELRVGPPGGLRALIDQLRSQAWNPSLSLEEELDRRQSGLGRELSAALRGPHSRGRWAVRAAFALYGPSAIEWLSDEPLRVVSELRRRLARQAPPGSSPGGDPGRRRGTRTANHSEAGADPRGSGARTDAGRSQAAAAGRPDPRREALSVLGLEPGASTQQIKRAYRQLAKAHHPDLGGDPEAFRRLDAAYRLLIGC